MRPGGAERPRACSTRGRVAEGLAEGRAEPAGVSVRGGHGQRRGTRPLDPAAKGGQVRSPPLSVSSLTCHQGLLSRISHLQCVTNTTHVQQLKATHGCSLAVPVGQGPGHGFKGFSVREFPMTMWLKCQQRLKVSQNWTEGGPTCWLTQVVVDRIQLLVGRWSESLSFSRAVGWRPPSPPSHVGAPRDSSKRGCRFRQRELVSASEGK